MLLPTFKHLFDYLFSLPRRRYFIAFYGLCSLGLTTFIISRQIVILKALDAQSQDARIINVAGKQRMLSQKVAKLSNQLYIAQIGQQNAIYNHTDIYSLKSELRNTLTNFTLAHQGLQQGSEQLQLPGDNSPSITAGFAKISPYFNALHSSATNLADPFSTDFDAYISTISANENLFLDGMNDIVHLYEQEATAQSQYWQRQQVQLLVGSTVLMAFILLGGYRLITYTQRLKQAHQHTDKQLQILAEQLTYSDQQVQDTRSHQTAARAQIDVTTQALMHVATQVVEHIQGLLQKTQTAHCTAASNEQEMAMVIAMMEELKRMTTAIAAQLESIRDRAQDIDQVVLTMTKVAHQTNLLSLNAAIEAEKAGEYGAGFSVVAKEIRRLADQCAIATLDIETLVKDMQSAAVEGVNVVETFTRELASSARRTGKVTQQTGQVSQQIQALLPALDTLMQQGEYQSDRTSQLQNVLAQLNQQTAKTSSSLHSPPPAIEPTTLEGALS